VPDLPAAVIRLALAIWVGGTLILVVTAPVLFGLPSRDQAASLFDEVLRRFEAIKHVVSLALVLAIFWELERDAILERREGASGIAVFLALASNVYLSLVLRPRMKYFRMKIGSFDAASPDDPRRRRFDVLHRRSIRVLVLGWIAAAAALLLR